MRYHLYDDFAVFTETVSVDPSDALPAWGTAIQPPELKAGQFAVWTGSAWEVRDERPSPPFAFMEVSTSDVDAERDRRLAAGMTFTDHVFQSDDASRERIDRSRISAMAAIMGGAQKGDLRWHGLPVDFFWIAADDTRMPMDAQTMVAFGNAMAAREGLLIVAGNDLKQRIASGEAIADIGSDALWPAA